MRGVDAWSPRSIDARKSEKLLLQERIFQITFEQSKRCINTIIA